ncbi:MAG TPA: hypothetical protein VEK08_12345 [Planctomycetota bacterium]|nr:hypothetical protein [Planctomycetota bacterium]
MMSKRTAILFLRVLSMMMMFIGAAGIIAGLTFSIYLMAFGTAFPAWLFSAIVLYFGLRNWRKIPAIEKQSANHSEFSLSFRSGR